MKKTKKLLAVLLAGIMLFAMFSVSASAKAMSKSEVVKFYHSILEKTAENNKVILVKNTWKSRDIADFSGLSGRDLKKTMEEYSYCDGEWYEEKVDSYLYGVTNEYEDADETEIYYWFDIKSKMEYGYTVKSAKYADNKIVILLEYKDEYDETCVETSKITAELGSSNVLKKITITDHSEWQENSVKKDIPFMVEFDMVDTYTFVYDKVPAKTLKLSEKELTLGYKGRVELTYTIGPENASYKGVYVEVGDNDVFTPIWAYEENGKIVVEAMSEGSGIVEVYTYSGDLVATCDVTVEYTFMEKIRSIFDNFFILLASMFGFYY